MGAWVCNTKGQLRTLGGNILDFSLFESLMDVGVSSQGAYTFVRGKTLNFKQQLRH